MKIKRIFSNLKNKLTEQNLKYGFKVAIKAFLFGGILTVISLEIGNHLITCPPPDFSKKPQCFEIPPESISNESILELEILRNKRRLNEKIKKTEYQEVFENLIIEVEKNDMPGINGISCGNYGYVRKDLPQKAKLFVKRHELEHMLQINHPQNEEFLATWKAASEYPIGFIQSLIFSFRKDELTENLGKGICKFLNSWKYFKIYYFP